MDPKHHFLQHSGVLGEKKFYGVEGCVVCGYIVTLDS